jgi:hypothetical protein
MGNCWMRLNTHHYIPHCVRGSFEFIHSLASSLCVGLIPTHNLRTNDSQGDVSFCSGGNLADAWFWGLSRHLSAASMHAQSFSTLLLKCQECHQRSAIRANLEIEFLSNWKKMTVDAVESSVPTVLFVSLPRLLGDDGTWVRHYKQTR